MKTLEIRTLRGLSVRDDGGKKDGIIGTLTGYAAVFNSDSVEFSGWEKPWVERIAPGAFKRSLAEAPDVVALWSHRADAPIARAPKTLRVEEDGEGLKVEISLADTSRNRDLLADVRSGSVDAMSFGFQARSTKWDEGKERDVRTLLDVDLFEVSAVVFPAYPATSLSARSLVCRAAGADLDAEMQRVNQERKAAFAAVAPTQETRAAQPAYTFSHWLAGIQAGRRPE